jgi:hypothetical protein
LTRLIVDANFILAMRNWRKHMRKIAFIITAAVITFGAGTASFAATAQPQKPTAEAINDCMALARQRGYTDDDRGKGKGARNFVIRCLQGKVR